MGFNHVELYCEFLIIQLHILILLEHEVFIIHQGDGVLNTCSTIVDVKILVLGLGTVSSGDKESVGDDIYGDHIDCIFASSLKIWNETQASQNGDTSGS